VAIGVSCSGESDRRRDLLSLVPSLTGGDRYLAVDVDGTCTADCPAPSRSQGVLVECDAVNATQDTYSAALMGAGLVAAGDVFEGELDGTVVRVTLLSYDDASLGPVPNVSPYETADDVRGSCALVAIAEVVDG
jgi:hypothetical protein